MKHHPAVMLFVAARLCCVAAGPVQLAPQLASADTKCSRMFPWMAGDGVRSCKYTCRGWPIRYENEPDGVSCQGGNGEHVCLNGNCVEKSLYSTTPSTESSSRTYATTLRSVPTTSKSPSSTGVPSLLVDTIMSTDSRDKPLSSPEVPQITQRTLTDSQETTGQQAFTTPAYKTVEPHTIGSLFSAETHAHTTIEERSPFHAATSFEPSSTATVDTIREQMAVSSLYPAARLPSSTEETSLADDTLMRSQEVNSDAALTTPSLVTSVPHRNTRAEHDITQTNTLPHQKVDFTDGSTTLIPHAPTSTSWKERPISSSSTVTEETVTSSAYQGAGFSSSIKDTNPSEVKFIRTREASSGGASTTPSLTTSLHNGKTSSDPHRLETYNITHVIGGFQGGPTTLSQDLINSSKTHTQEFTTSPTQADVHFGPVTNEIHGVRLSTHQVAPSTNDYAASSISTSKHDPGTSAFPGEGGTNTRIRPKNVSTPHPTSPQTYLPTTMSLRNNGSRTTFVAQDSVSDLIVNRSTNPKDGFFRTSTTASGHSPFTPAFPEADHADTAANQDISEGYPTVSDQLLTYSSSATKPDIAFDSRDTQEPYTNGSYTTNSETKISDAPVDAKTFSSPFGYIKFNQTAGTGVLPTELVTASENRQEDNSTHHLTSAEGFFTSVGLTSEEASSTPGNAKLFPENKWGSSVAVTRSVNEQQATEARTTPRVPSTDIHHYPEAKYQTTFAAEKWDSKASTHHPTAPTPDSLSSAQSGNSYPTTQMAIISATKGDESAAAIKMTIKQTSASLVQTTTPSGIEEDTSAPSVTIPSRQLVTEQGFTSSILIPDKHYTAQDGIRYSPFTVMPHLPPMQNVDLTSSKKLTSTDNPAIPTNMKMLSIARSVAKSTSQPWATEESFTSPNFFTTKQYASHITPQNMIAIEYEQKGMSTHHPTTSDPDSTSSAKPNDEETSSSSANVEISSGKEIKAVAAVNGSTINPRTLEPTFPNTIFTTHNHYANPGEEQSATVNLDQTVSAHNQTSNFGLPFLAVSTRERSTSTSAHGEWPSSTENSVLEERGTTNRQSTTTQIAAVASTSSKAEYYTEKRPSPSGVETVATALVRHDSTPSSAAVPQKETSFLLSSKQLKSTTTHTVASTTEMRALSEQEVSSEQVPVAKQVSTTPVSTNSTKFPTFKTSTENKTSRATPGKTESPDAPTSPNLRLMSHISESKESKSNTLPLRAGLIALCGLFVFITVYIKCSFKKHKFSE